MLVLQSSAFGTSFWAIAWMFVHRVSSLPSSINKRRFAIMAPFVHGLPIFRIVIFMVLVNMVDYTVDKHHRLAATMQLLATRKWTITMQIVEVRAIQRIPRLVFRTFANSWAVLSFDLATIHIGMTLTKPFAMRHR